MAEVYPASLPGVLSTVNSYGPQSLVRQNDLQSGPPTFRLEDDTAWELFSVGWSFSEEELQIFRNWHKWTLSNGSKLFEIELRVEGFDGVDSTKLHSCYFLPSNPPYSVVQSGKRWRVGAQLLAIEQQVETEAFANQLMILANGFPDGVLATFLSLDELIKLMEIKLPG